MSLLIHTVISFAPCIPLIILALSLNKFGKISNKRSSIKQCKIQFTKMRDFFPKNIRNQLSKNATIIPRFIDELIAAYKKLLYALCFYIIFWIAYIVFIIIRINWIFNGHYELYSPDEFRESIASTITSCLVLYWLFLTPIFEALHFPKLSKLGYLTLECLYNFTEKVYTWFKRVVKFILEFVISLLVLNMYITPLLTFLISTQIEITIRLLLVILIFYQYVILNFFSLILKNLILFVNRKFKKLECIRCYAQNNIMYPHLKNFTYLSMVAIYARAISTNVSETPLISAIGILFLIDTFIEQEKSINKMLEKEK